MSLSNALLLATACVYGSEGFAAVAYLDTMPRVPVWTIGHGTTRIDGRAVMPGQRCTRLQADDWAMTDMTSTARFILAHVTCKLDDCQLAALISFAYNIGVGAFRRSSVCALLNQGQLRIAANDLLNYDEAGERVIAGLSARRMRERTLFLSRMAPDTRAPAPAPPSLAPPAPPALSEADALNAAELTIIRNSRS